MLNALAQTWIAVNGWWMALMQRIDWQVSGLDGLRQRAWYLVSSNHRTWVDISSYPESVCRSDPVPPKFFLKRELMYVPFMAGARVVGPRFFRSCGAATVDATSPGPLPRPRNPVSASG